VEEAEEAEAEAEVVGKAEGRACADMLGGSGWSEGIGRVGLRMEAVGVEWGRGGTFVEEQNVPEVAASRDMPSWMSEVIRIR
jgi:hypothetical protein